MSPGRQITARRAVAQRPEDVFEFLSDFGNHWLLERAFALVGEIEADGGRVRITGPLGVSRVASTRVVAASAPVAGNPGRLDGVAEIGTGTIGRVRWEIAPDAGGGSLVTLSARVERASPLDRVLLAVGGRVWLERSFERVLDALASELAGDVTPDAGTTPDWMRDGVVAGAVAALVSGAPSTVHAFATRRDPLEATVAAGSVLLRGVGSRGSLVLAAVPVHLGLSLGWAIVLSRILPSRRTALAGAAAGLAIAALDLGLVGRRSDRIRALPLAPQLADHVAFGAVVGAVVARRRSRRHRAPRPPAPPRGQGTKAVTRA